MSPNMAINNIQGMLQLRNREKNRSVARKNEQLEILR